MRCTSVGLLLALGLALGLGSGVSCSSAGSRLAKSDAGDGAGGTTTTSGTGASALGPITTSSGAGGAGGDPEPAGPTKLTVVNGVVDYDAVRLCFMAYPGGTEGDPWPALPGLAFARGRVVDPIDSVLPSGTDVQLFVVGGALALSQGQSCAELVAAPPPADAGPSLLVTSTGVLPASALSAEKSLLLVLYGCLGGAGHQDDSQEAICGMGYAPDSPNVGVVAGAMSRQVHTQRVGMQFVQGSAAMQPASLRVKAGAENATAFMAVNGWMLGAIAPYPPWWQFRRSDLQSVPEASLEVYTYDQGTPADTISFAEALGNSALDEQDLVDGEGFVFVAVGAMPGLVPGPWWRELTFTVVRADP